MTNALALPFMPAGPRGFAEFLRRVYARFYPETSFEQSRELIAQALERARAKYPNFEELLPRIDRASLEIEPKWPETSVDDYLAELVAVARVRAARLPDPPKHGRRSQ